jgi:hypothetical protein
MSPSTFYRCALWLPLLLPAIVAVLVHGLGMPTTGIMHKVVQVLLMSGVYGGVPYALLAAYATWWIDHRPEDEIRRRALVAPLWMIGLWWCCAMVIGILARRAEMFLGLGALGTAVIVPLGYAYVALVLLVRRLVLHDAPAAAAPAGQR